jgi:glutaredoxin
MKELIFFRLKNCPYCRNAKKWLRELMEEDPAYKEISIKYIDEDEQPDIANSYDYYYVPTFFCGTEKLHEGAATKEKIRAVLDYCLTSS